MQKKILALAISAMLFNSSQVLADSETQELKEQLESLKQDYQQRIQALELKLQQIETKTQEIDTTVQYVEKRQDQNNENKSVTATPPQSTFNPAISLILDGQYASYANDPADYKLPGFMLGGDAGLGNQGFSLGESELTFSSNIDDKFYGQLTLAFGGDADNTDVSVEEAFFQTLSLADGLNVKAGRFFSAMGYLNEQHAHVWDFADAPLIYRGLFGNQLVDDGVQASYLLPTDTFMEIGAEVSNGSHFPGADTSGGIGAWTVFYNIGDDIGISHSWQLGISHWQADNVDQRESNYLDVSTLFSGDSKINELDFVYKWAPNGNPINTNFKLQFEYFDRQEDGLLTNHSVANYDGHQDGGYVQAIYQFIPQWKVGGRFDQVSSNNKSSNTDILNIAGLNSSFSPKRYSTMIEWLPSEFSRLRIQYNYDQSYQDYDNQLFLQYTFSLGTHGAHQY